MKKEKRAFSEDVNLRLCIINNTIFIEYLISFALGSILNIDFKSSKSFGFSSAALSFNQKIQIVCDFKTIDKLDVSKLNCLANIRNKFAHVFVVDTFNSLFEGFKVGKQIKKELENWYGDKLFDKNLGIEERYREYFYSLVDEITTLVLNIMFEHKFEKGKETGIKLFNEELVACLSEEILNIDQGLDILNKAILKAEKQINTRKNLDI